MKKIAFVLSILTVCLFTCLFSCVSPKQSSGSNEKKSISKKEKEEFLRSTQDVDISLEEFSADKIAIFQVIKELANVMEMRDYNAWKKYIEPASITYWSQQKNLIQAGKRLPNKRRLLNLNDYFNAVFIPARKGREINEIRYISRTSVKAVQMQKEQDVVYYNFVKLNGKWMVRLPQISH